MSRAPVVVVENDPFPRLLRAFLSAGEDAQADAAITDFVAHEGIDYPAWLAAARERAGAAYPADVRLAGSAEELHAHLPDADALVVESLPVTRDELERAPRLRVVHKYGKVMRNVDAAACAARGVAVLKLRRRANIACAEHAFALLLALTRRLMETDGLVSMESLRAAGFPATMFDTRYTPNSNWARVGGLRTLHGMSAGILGMGEIGREIALLAHAFGMTVSYHQRTPLAPDEEAAHHARHLPLDEMLAACDVVFVALPANPSTRGLLGARELGRMKRGAILVNVSRAAIVDRAALLDALRTRRLAGLGLDTFYEEPGSQDDPLLALDNAIVTPRVAAQPRWNALTDLADVMANLGAALGAGNAGRAG